MLLINPDKTKLLLLGTRQVLRKIPDDIHVTLLGKQIYPVSSAKGLEKCANFAKIAKVTRIFLASEKKNRHKYRKNIKINEIQDLEKEEAKKGFE